MGGVSALDFGSWLPEVGEGLTTNYFRVGISTNLRDRHSFQDARYNLP